MVQTQKFALIVLLHGLLGHRILQHGHQLGLNNLLPCGISVRGTVCRRINRGKGEAILIDQAVNAAEIAGIYLSVALHI
ncbi:hypothetical protein D3C75_1010250 [compost metagenome]